MDYGRNYVTTKNVKDSIAVYDVHWSPMVKVHKYAITTRVPAMPGLFELYYKDKAGNFTFFYMEKVWYGGLRAEIRRASDPVFVPDPKRRQVLLNEECHYRYTIVNSRLDLMDLLHEYSLFLQPSQPPPESSGRYEKIFLHDDR